MHRTIRGLAAPLLLMLFAPFAAAGPIFWSYTVDVSPDLIPVVGGIPGVGVGLSPSQGSGEGHWPQQNPAAFYWSNYSLGPDDPLYGPTYAVDTLKNSFTLTIHFRDDASGEVADLTSQWEAFGTVSLDDPTSVYVSSSYSNTWTPVLGGNQYYISMWDLMLSSPAPGITVGGEIDFDVDVGPQYPVDPVDAPEPATVTLGALAGLLLGGAAGWRRLLSAGLTPA